MKKFENIAIVDSSATTVSRAFGLTDERYEEMMSAAHENIESLNGATAKSSAQLEAASRAAKNVNELAVLCYIVGKAVGFSDFLGW